MAESLPYTPGILKRRITLEMTRTQAAAMERLKHGDSSAMQNYLDEIYVTRASYAQSDLQELFNTIFFDLYRMDYQNSQLIGILQLIKLDNEVLDRKFFVQITSQQLKYFLFHFNSYCSSFAGKKKWEDNPLSKMMRGVYSPIHEYFRNGKIAHLEIVLNHGYRLECSDDQLFVYKFLCDGNNDLSLYVNFLRRSDRDPTRRPSIEDITADSSSDDESYDSDASLGSQAELIHDVRERGLLALLTIYAFLTVRLHPGKRENILHCLELIWRSVPNRYVTHFQLRSIMNEFNNRRDMVEAVKDCSSSGILGYEDIYQPRLLKHYCRCRIRDCLIKNWKLPEGVSTLNLPAKLKGYLLLET